MTPVHDTYDWRRLRGDYGPTQAAPSRSSRTRAPQQPPQADPYAIPDEQQEALATQWKAQKVAEAERAKATADAVKFQEKQEKDRQSAIKSAASDTAKRLKDEEDFTSEGYAKQQTQLQNRLASIEGEWEADAEASKGGFLRNPDAEAASRIPTHQTEWNKAKGELDSLNTDAYRRQKSLPQLQREHKVNQARADAINDADNMRTQVEANMPRQDVIDVMEAQAGVQPGKQRILAKAKQLESAHQLQTRLKERSETLQDPAYREQYVAEMGRKGIDLTQPKQEAQAGPTKANAANITRSQTLPPQPDPLPPVENQQQDPEVNAFRALDAKRQEFAAKPVITPEQALADGYDRMSSEQKAAYVKQKHAERNAELARMDEEIGWLGQKSKATIEGRQGVTGYDGSEGLDIDNLYKESARMLKSATGTAGNSYAAAWTGLMDTGAALASLTGADPNDTWFKQQADLVRNYWDGMVSDEDRGTIGMQLVGGLTSAHSFLAPTAIARTTLAGTAAARAVGTGISKVPLIGRSLQGASAAELGLVGAGAIGAALTGAFVNGGSAYNEALANGFTNEQALQKFAASFGLGMTEAAGVGTILNRINILGRGGLGKFFRNLGAEGIEEGSQEFVESAGSDIADLLILPKGDPRTKKLTEIAADAAESGLWGATIGILTAGMMDAAMRRGRKAMVSRQQNLIGEQDQKTNIHTPEAIANQEAVNLTQKVADQEWTGDVNKELAGWNATNPETAIPENQPLAVTLEKLDRIRAINLESLPESQQTNIKQAQAVLEAEVAAKGFTPEQVQVAADLVDGVSSRYAANEARISELKTEIASMLPAKETFLSPADYEGILEKQSEVTAALDLRQTLAQDAGRGSDPEAFRKALPIAKEIAGYPDIKADPDGNGVRNGSTQRDIAKAIYQLTGKNSLPVDGNSLVGSNRSKVFGKGADGRTVITNNDTLASLKAASPLLYQAYENYLSRPISEIEQARTQQKAKAKEGTQQPAGDSKPAGVEQKGSQDKQLGRYRVVAVDPANPGNKAVVAEFEAGDQTAAERMSRGDMPMPDGNIIDTAKGIDGQAIPAGWQTMVEEVVAPKQAEKTPADVLNTVATTLNNLAQAQNEADLTAAQTAVQAAEAEARKLVDPYLKGWLDTVSKNVFDGKVNITLRNLGSGGMIFTPSDKTLNISLYDLISGGLDQDRILAVASEEIKHFMVDKFTTFEDRKAIFEGMSPEFRQAVLEAYPTLQNQGQDNQYHEAIRFVLDRFIKLDANGTLEWVDTGGQKNAEQLSPTLANQFRAALAKMAEFLQDLKKLFTNDQSKALYKKLEADIKGYLGKVEAPAEVAKEPAPVAPEVTPTPEVAPIQPNAPPVAQQAPGIINLTAPQGDIRNVQAEIRILDLDTVKGSEGTTAQPRDRDSRAAYDAQTYELARSWDPAQASIIGYTDRGAIVTSEEGRIISGHGRSRALKMLFARPELAEKAQQQREFVVNYFLQRGMTAEAEAARTAKVPAIGTQVTDLGDYKQFKDPLFHFARDSNPGNLSDAEVAMADAKDERIQPVLQRLTINDDGQVNFAPSDRANLAAIARQFSANEYLDEDGNTTQKFYDRILRASLAHLLGQKNRSLVTKLIENAREDGLQQFTNALLLQAPALSKAKETTDVVDKYIVPAITEYVKWKREGGKGTFQEYANQGDFLRGNLDPNVVRIANAIGSVKGTQALADALREIEMQETMGSLFSQAAPATSPDLRDITGPTRFSNAVVTPEGTQAIFSQMAYHGTPHKVDRFSLDKIGTGEGAQAYGWGLYFAEAKPVAEEYKKRLESTHSKKRWDGKPFTFDTVLEVEQKDGWRLSTLFENAAKYGKRHTLQAFEPRAQNQSDGKLWREAINQFSQRFDQEGDGNLYAVELDVEPEDLIDWDKPIGPKLAKQISNFAGHLGVAANAEMNGSEAYAAVSRGNPIQGSTWLLQLGIKGIRYLDQGSRKTLTRTADGKYFWPGYGERFDTKEAAEQFAAGNPYLSQNTYNYVIFDESRIRIVAENDQPVEQLRSQSATTLPRLTPDARDGIVRRAQSLRIIPRMEDRGIPGPATTGEAGDNRQAQTHVLTAIREAEQIARAIGASIEIAAPGSSSGVTFSPSMGVRSMARYLIDDARIVVAPHLAPNGTTLEAARAYIREEIIHAAQAEAARQDFIRNPDGAENLRAFMGQRYESIARDLARTDAGRKLLESSFLAYNTPLDQAREPQAVTPEEWADLAISSEAALELTRQLVQLRESGQLTEGTMRSALRTLSQWFQKALQVLRRAAKQSPSPLLDEAIQQTIDLLNGGGEINYGLQKANGLQSAMGLPLRGGKLVQDAGGRLPRLASQTSETSPLGGDVLAAFEAAIQEARPAFATLGADVRVETETPPDNAPWARFSNAEKRAIFYTSIAPTQSTPEYVRAIVREELIHAAQLAVAEQEYQRDPKGAQDAADYYQATYLDIARELAETERGQELLERSVNAYTGGAYTDNRFQRSEIVLNALENPQRGVELLRQLVQLRMDGQLSEGALRRAYNKLTQWFKKTLQILRRAAQQSPSPLLDQTIQQTVDLLNGGDGGAIRSQSPLTPAQLDGHQRTYNELFRRQREGEKLTPGQLRALDRAEQALGQQLLFDVERTFQPAEDLALETEEDSTQQPQGEQLALFSQSIKTEYKDFIARNEDIFDLESALPFIGTPQEEVAALAAFSRGGFTEMNASPDSPVTKALLRLLDKLPPASNIKAIHRVLGFQTQKDADDYVAGMGGFSSTQKQRNPVTSWTQDDPRSEKAGPMTNIGLDVASQFGDFNVILTIENPRAAKDVSFIYSERSDNTGLEYLLPQDTTTRIVAGKKTSKGWQITMRQTNNFPGLEQNLFSQAPSFYSRLEQVIEAKMPNRASSDQIKAIINPEKGSGVKAEEIKWSGIMQWLDARKGATKGEVLEHLRTEGSVRFEEVTLGGATKQWTQADIDRLEKEAQRTRDWTAYEQAVLEYEDQQLGSDANNTGNQTKYGQYQLPGGENYREVVLAMPLKDAVGDWRSRLPEGLTPQQVADIEAIQARANKELQGAYTSSHFPDIPNYVAHMRLNERDNGLFIEEIQSDRHQAGRERGYVGDKRDDGSVIGNFGLKSGIPDAPYRKEWPIALFKRAFRDAVESGKDWIGWTTGDTQAERYDLSKQVESVRYFANADGSFNLQVYGLDGNEDPIIEKENISREELADTIGKDLANQAVEGKGDRYGYAGWKGWEGDGLKIGGEGMKGFYDVILPKEIGKYVKQWGAKVEKTQIPTGISKSRSDVFETVSPGISYSGRWDVVRRDQGSPHASFDTKAEADAERTRLNGGESTPIWRVDITPEMRESIRDRGQALFSQLGRADVEAGQLLLDFDGMPKPPAAIDRRAPLKALDDEQRKLVRDNLQLAGWAANRYSIIGMDAQDIRQEAILGIVRAAQTFDPTRGVPFGAYASKQISRQISDAIRKAIKTERTDSLNAPLHDDTDETRIDQIEGGIIAEDTERAEGIKVLQAAIATLPPQAKEILKARAEGQTFAEIAKATGITRQRAETAAKRAAEMMRRKLAEKGITHRDQLFPEDRARTSPVVRRQETEDADNQQMLDAREPEAINSQQAPYEVVTQAQAETELGRAQPDDEVVLTPDGPRPIGELQADDVILGPNAEDWQVVRGVYPQGEQDIVEIELSNGARVRATEDHLWRAAGPDGTFYPAIQTQAIGPGWKLPVNLLAK